MLIRHTLLYASAVLFLATTARAEPQLKDYSAEAQAAFTKAQQLQKAEQYRDALEWYAKADKLGMTEYPGLKLHRAECEAALKDYARAIDGFTQLIETCTVKNFCRH